MSYILDALKKADAERERGGVPGLHARSAAPAPAPQNRSGRTGTGLALAAGLALAGVAGMVWWGHTPVEVAPSTPGPALAPTPTVPPAAAIAPLPAPAPTLAAAPAAAAPPPPAKPEPRTPAKPAAEMGTGAKPVSASASTTIPAPPTATAPLLSELPADIRGQIPALAVSGSVYSENPSQRLLLINGQVLPQGSLVAPDVTLLEIQRGSSEFSFRGTRFRLAH